MKFQSQSIQQVWLDPAVSEKIWNWVDIAKGEVSMLGLVEECEDGPLVSDIFLVKQRCTSASTEMDPDDIARLMFDLAAAGLEGGLRAWIHSHGEMGTFWSQTDDDTIEGFGFEPYAVSLVVNKKGNIKARLDLFEPIRCTIDDIPVRLRLPGLNLEDACRSEFKVKVREELMPAIGKNKTTGIPQEMFWDDPLTNPMVEQYGVCREPMDEPWPPGEIGLIHTNWPIEKRGDHGCPF